MSEKRVKEERRRWVLWERREVVTWRLFVACRCIGRKGHGASQRVSWLQGSRVLEDEPPDARLALPAPLSWNDQDHPSTRSHLLWDAVYTVRRQVSCHRISEKVVR